MRKISKRITTIVISIALMLALMPMQALANDTLDTLSDIPIYLRGDNDNYDTLQGNAKIKLSAIRYESVKRGGLYEYSIDANTGTTLVGLGPQELNTTMDTGYDFVEMYIVHITGIKAESFPNGAANAAVITVPVPEGCLAAGAKRIYNWAWHMDHQMDYTKVDVTVNDDGTISFPGAMWTIDYGEDGCTLNGVYVIEYKKAPTDIATLAAKAKLDPATAEYTGSAITPTVTITGLTENTDFTVAYSNNTNVGEAKATVTGKGAYTGTLELKFNITPASITGKKADASLSATEFDHTGSAITPDVTITGLTKDTDYTVAYANNIEPGTATATITGKGNYKDSFTLEFTIKKAEETDMTEAKVEDKSGQDYTVKSDGEKKEATYEAPKSNKETSVKIPDKITLKDGTKVPVTKVAPNACKKNKKLKSATIGNYVKDVGDNAFNGCSNLTTLKFGKRVENIGKGAARNCKKLKKANIPSSTKKIGANAFNGDSSLTNLTINCKNLKSVGNGAIKKINPKATITLKGTAKQKKAAEKLITNKKTGYKSTMKIKK